MPGQVGAMAKPKRKGGDLNVTAFNTLNQFLDRNDPELKAEKNPAAVALGRLGGLKGGKARAAALSKNERSDIAKSAARARWSKK